MDRAEAAGFGVAAVGHVALLAALSVGFASTVTPPSFNPPMEVSFVDEVALESAAPSSEPAAASVAPEFGPPEEAAPETLPEPSPPAPAPEPAPVPKAEPRPQPKQVARPKETPKPAPPKAAPKAAPAKSKQAKQATPKAAPKQQTKNAGKGEAQKSSGSRLGKDFLEGIGSDPVAKGKAPSGAVLSAQSLASIQAAIQRQIQPCANRQVNPGPGANRIKVRLNIRLNRNGTLARRPTVMSTSGVTDENARYEERVKDLAIASYTGCSPLKGLPEDLYSTPKGGWSNLVMNYSLPD